MPLLQQEPGRDTGRLNMTLTDHYEQHLGRIDRGWSSQGPAGVQVCLFRNQPMEAAYTLATLGLSTHELLMNNSRTVRQELLLSASKDAPDELAKLLFYLSEDLLAGHRALLRGQVVHLSSPIVPGSHATDLYASIPVVFPDALATFTETSPPTVCVWLFPVLPNEVGYISSRGWGAFEELLERKDPNLFDLNRKSVIEP